MTAWNKEKSVLAALDYSVSDRDGWNAFSPEEDFAKEISSGIVRVSRVNENFRVRDLLVTLFISSVFLYVMKHFIAGALGNVSYSH